MPEEFEPLSMPSSGIYVKGLILHNAHWDYNSQKLVNGPVEKALMPLSICWLKPVQHKIVDSRAQSTRLDQFSCPLYIGCNFTASVTTKSSYTKFSVPILSLNLASSLSSLFLRQRDVHLCC